MYLSVKKPSSRGLAVYLALLAAFLLMATMLFSQGPTQSLIKYSEVLGYFENGQVSEFDLNLGSGEMQMTVELKNQRTTVNYRVPNVSLFLEDIRDDIESYNGAHPDAHMVYDLERAQEIPWFVSMLPTADSHRLDGHLPLCDDAPDPGQRRHGQLLQGPHPHPAGRAGGDLRRCGRRRRGEGGAGGDRRVPQEPPPNTTPLGARIPKGGAADGPSRHR